ncbi:DNA gyrase subunit A, partial [bacterium]
MDIKDEMKQSFMDYAMSVIVSRALPDVRDGLKPVHRRILFAMHELNMTPDKPFKKSARIVGEVLGKFHPHGDSSVYEAMVRMAQDFSTRYLMVDGQGNFGSVDDDPPAAMRYTEARLSKFATEMLVDLEADTVEWNPNFDATLQEPDVLPAMVPNLLLNGVTGIAVGMATSIPPHNLEEICSAIIHLVDNKDVTSLDLYKNYVKGPDFPTGGIIIGEYGIRQAYTTGRGSVTVRAVMNLEESKKGKTSIVVTEIPYQISKRRLLEQIADLVRDKKLEGISDLRDESDKDGMRIVIDLKRDAVSQVVMNNLYKQTILQSNFGINMLAIVDKKPKILDLKQILEAYLEHRQEIITRRTSFFLNKANARDHIVEGLLVVQENVDKVIKDIRASNSTQEAQERLMTNYQLSQIQASAVLDMQLRRLTALEKKKLDDEHLDLLGKINDFKDILANPERINKIIKEELQRMIDKHKDKRRTQFMADPGDFRHEDLIPNEKMAVFMTEQGYIKKVILDEFENQGRGGRGKGGLTTRDEDFVKHFFVSSNHASVLFITSRGVVYSLKVYELPEAGRQAKGSSIANLLPLQPDEKVTAVIPVSKFDDEHHLVMLTKSGVIKKTNLSAFDSIRSSGIIAINLDEGDELGWVTLSDGQSNIVIGTSNGYAIRYPESNIRSLSRTARGVNAMHLRDGDSIVSFDLVSASLIPNESVDEAEEIEDKVSEEEEITEEVVNTPCLLTVTTDGYGKRTPLHRYRLQSRNGLGVRNIKLKENSNVASILFVQPDDEIMIATFKGIVIRQKVSDTRIMSRNTKGVRLQKLDSDDRVMAVQIVIDPDKGSTLSHAIETSIDNDVVEGTKTRGWECGADLNEHVAVGLGIEQGLLE